MTTTTLLAGLPRLSCADRGPVSAAALAALTAGDGAALDSLHQLASDAVTTAPQIRLDEDLQLALFVLYASSYGSFSNLDPELEWDPRVTSARAVIERALEEQLRAEVAIPALPAVAADTISEALFELTGADTGPSVARFLAKRASDDQAREFLIQRSIYTLREADPHSWAIPRLTGRPKAALVEIQSDEYGGGRPQRVHAEIFARTMHEVGLDPTYGAYLDAVPAVTLASQNVMSMFGLNRRLVGAIVGHLAAFEMTSSIPNRHTGEGFRRLGYGPSVTDYFDEHVEADAVHEQIAGRDLAGALGEDRPELLPDILFGAAACLMLDGASGAHMITQWEAEQSSLRGEGAA